MWMLWLAASCGVTTEVASTPSSAASSAAPKLVTDFWDHWGDGRAEVSGYRLRTPRYGELREGRSTLVFVTETFTHGQRVKSDGGHADEYPVLKVNVIRDFQTGIYDYNVMTSSFHRLDHRGVVGRPVKVSMSMQEWCGHVYEQLVPESDALAWTAHSYFDGEADRNRALALPPDGVLVDALPAMVRGLLGPVVRPGQRITRPALPTLESGRLSHRAPEWTTVTIEAGEQGLMVTVPAGTFEVDEVRTTVGDGPSTSWYVESAWPHRLVRWVSSHGEEAEMLGTERLAYWQLHDNADEPSLERIGFGPGGPSR